MTPACWGGESCLCDPGKGGDFVPHAQRGTLHFNFCAYKRDKSCSGGPVGILVLLAREWRAKLDEGKGTSHLMPIRLFPVH